MTSVFNTPFADNLIGLWDFLDGGKTHDTGLADGIAQNGHLHGGACISGGQLHTDGNCDYFDVSGQDAPFDLATGTIEVQFTQSAHVGSSPDTIVNRGEYADRGSEGFFEIRVTQDGRVEVMHCSNGADSILSTGAGFFSPGDTVNVTYSWNETTGATFLVENLSEGTDTTITSGVTGLTMDIGDNDDENFTFAAREYDDGSYDHFFNGSINYVAIYDIDTVNGAPNGIVSGTDGNDTIDVAYTGDPEGDRIDNGDAILPGEGPQDDIVVAGGGDDFVLAGDGNDDVYGGEGNDTLCGQDGDDVLLGGVGNDLLEGMNDNDMALGGAGADRVYGDAGDDLLDGGAGNDTVIGGSGQDVVSGGEGNDSLRGGADDDTLIGGAGSDTILGGSGDDVIYGGGQPGATSNLITNGSFEDTTGMTATGYGFVGAGSAPGWTESNGDAIDFHNDGRGGVDASDGSNWLDLAASPSNGLIGQDVAGVSDGQSYLLTFDAADGENLPGGENFVQVFWGGELIATIDPENDDMTQYEFIVVGGAGNGSDRLEFGGLSGNDNFGASIDNVSLVGLGTTGADQADVISGGTGDDLIIGGTGADTLSGGDDRDTFIGATAGDIVDGGEGGLDFDTLDLTGAAEAANPGGSLNVIYDTNPENGTVEFRDADGVITGSMQFSNIETVVPCFTAGTMIATPKGERRVEDLQVGDRVITRDNGIQEIRWIGARAMKGTELRQNRHLRPVLIRKGALGNGLPERDMTVSPNHRILVSNDKTALYFEESEVLVAAKHLVGLEGVDVVDASWITYIHFMFDQHEVVLSDGAWTESFQPGDQSLAGIGNAQRNEILELFPELKTPAGIESYKAARRSLKKYEASLLTQ